MGKVLGPTLPWFDKWMRDTGQTVPDFDTMPSVPDLPPLLRFADGRAVQTPADWQARRTEVLDQLCHWLFGTMPATPPTLVDSRLLAEEREPGLIRQKVLLTFDTSPRVSIDIEIARPDGAGPYPVFLTQTTHHGWMNIGASRGYLSVMYPGSDEDDQSTKFIEVYPECDWMTIARRAWLAGRVLDYVLSLPEADASSVGITGHSRNGKQSLIATAIEPRIMAVVSSSSGSSGAVPYRFASETSMQESVEFMTRQIPDWFHPRTRWFTGREDKLPMDIHGLIALCAPRPCLLSDAFNDGCGNPFGGERAYLAAKQVYELLDAPEALRVRWRQGNHETCAEDVQSYFDFYDHAAGRGAFEFGERLYFTFDWDLWHAQVRPVPAAPLPKADQTRAQLQARVRWALGHEPPRGAEWGVSYGGEKAHDAMMIGRGYVPDGVTKTSFNFGDYICGDLYHPAEHDGAPLPVVIWLHSYNYSSGYGGAYMVGPRIYHHLASRGYAVAAFDLVGFGRRIMEGAHLYDRFPHWSRLGAMVRDVQAMLTFLRGGEGRFPFITNERFTAALPPLDTDRIFLLGYSLGGTVALHAAALDERIAGIASFAGFTPMRTDTDGSPTGGLRRLWQWHGLQPRLGLYHGREAELPYDYEDVLALIAPRPCLIVSPVHDRENSVADVTRCVRQARGVWDAAGAGDALTHLAPEDYSRFQPEQHEIFTDWMSRVCAAKQAVEARQV